MNSRFFNSLEVLWLCKQSLQVLRGFLDPVVVGQRVGTERFDVSLPVVVIERPMQAERAGVWRVNQARRVAGAHLEKHARLEFGQRLPPQEPVHVVVCVAGGNDMKSTGRAFTDETQQRGGWIDAASGLAAAGKTEF